MNGRRDSVEKAQSSEQQQPNEAEHGTQIVKVKGLSNDESPPDILKLDIDCFEEAFDILSLKDLIAVGQTCRRLNQVAGYIFKQNYPATKVRLHRRKIVINDSFVVYFKFNRYIRELTMPLNAKLNDFWYISSNQFYSLKSIVLEDAEINPETSECIIQILGKIESLKLSCCRFDGDFYEHFLKHCVNLKHLQIIAFYEQNSIDGLGNGWLQQKFPKLEHLELILHHRTKDPILELGTFFTKNPNVQRLTLDEDTFWLNRVIILDGLHLDILQIEFYSIDIMEGNFFYDFMILLHAKKCYQRLQISCCSYIELEVFARMASLPAFDKLEFVVYTMDLAPLSVLTQLKEVTFNSRFIGKKEEVGALKELINLEQIHFMNVSVTHIYWLICHLKSLKAIKTEYLMDEVGFGYNNVHYLRGLPACAKERTKLSGARKIKWYVPEEVYLNTKWKLNETNFGLVEIKRFSSIK